MDEISSQTFKNPNVFPPVIFKWPLKHKLKIAKTQTDNKKLNFLCRKVINLEFHWNDTPKMWNGNENEEK